MKKVIYSIILLLASMTTTGCFEKDSMENIDIYTTVYPITYFTEQLYGTYSTVYSVYPSNIDIKTYYLTDKQITDYSKASLFIYNGLDNEKEYAIDMLNKNNNLKIIDAAMGMQYNSSQEELWLDPSNALMLVQNIKDGFHQYLSNQYLKNEIDLKYEELKIKISEVDAELKLTAENATDKTLIVSDDLFLYLSKFGFHVISIQENENLTPKVKDEVSKLMASGSIKYIITKENEANTETMNEFINKYKVTTLGINTLSTHSNEQTEDYIKIMYNNIDLIKKELYE